MTLLSEPIARRPVADRVAQELDASRQSGSLRQVLIPPCPRDLMLLREALADDPPDVQAVARIARGDVAIAATLLRNANSAAAAVGPPVQTVGQALDRLGLDTTARLMTGFIAQHALPVSSKQLERFWERSRKRAAAMHFIAAQLPGVSPGLAHACGLFWHVGLPVLLQSVKGYASTLVEAKARIDRPFIATENANHRTDHAVAGALVARAWRLAPEVMCAIRLHHDFSIFGSHDTSPDVQTLVAAGLVAEHLMHGHEGLPAEADWQHHGADALAWLQVSRDDLQQWSEGISEALDLA